jgi:predicted HTH transcriptional regulator
MPSPLEVYNEPEKYWALITAASDDQIEGQHFDRKQAGRIDESGQVTKNSVDTLKDQLIECISAFANALGGLIIVGVSKKGEITGINHLQERQLNSLLDFNKSLRNQSAISKMIDCVNINDQPDRIILVFIPSSINGICETLTSPPKAWLRTGMKCEFLTDEMRETLKRNRGIVDFERGQCCPFEINEVDHDVLEQFRKSWLQDSHHQYDDRELLFNAGALERDTKGNYFFTNAGYLFFGNNPQRIFNWAYIRILRLDTNSEEMALVGLTIFDRQFDGALPQQIRKIRAHFSGSGFFKVYQRRKPEGGFVEEPEFPPIAIDEVIVNAIAHRDYGIHLPIECSLYHDALITENPGQILQRGQSVPPEFSLSDVILNSMPRNSKLIEWLKLIKDDDGAAFVRARSEGTKRMQAEMSKLGLPSPLYKTDPSRTIVILYNNSGEREAQLRAEAITTSSTEYINLFPLRISNGNVDNATSIDLRNRFKDILQYFKDALEAKGWYIDFLRFSQIIAHRRGANLNLPEQVRKHVHFFPAYIFQFREYQNQLFLCVDYTLEVKNILSVRNLLKLVSPETLQDRRAEASLQIGWKKCQIIEANNELTKVRLKDDDREEYVGSEKVIPDLPIEKIKEVLSAAQVRFDLSREIKRESLALEANSSRLRSEKTLITVSDLKKSIFPLQINGARLNLHDVPLALKRGEETVFPLLSLPEPSVEFNHHRESPNIREGITSFGSYDTDPKTIELIPICLYTMRDKMAALIERLKVGKFKYAGSERTFSTRFTYTSIINVDSAEKMLGECERLLEERPEWKGNNKLERLFLVQTPEVGYALDDEQSPYYQVKRFLLEQGIPCQMIDTPTLENPDWKDLNLSLNIIAKCGVTPWVLPNSIPDADFFIGLSYTQSHSRGLRRLLGYATVFNQFGRWEFYSGNTDAFSYDEREKYFALLTESTLSRLSQASSLSERPNIYFHYSARFSKYDRSAILDAARRVRPNGTYNFVSINSHHNIRLYDSRPETDGSLSRGSYVIVSPKQILISTTGYNPYRKSIGTPKPLEVTIWVEPPPNKDFARPDLRALANQILSLTKLNWASTDSLCGEPITVKFAGDIAYLTDAFLRQTGKFTLHPVLEKTPWFI